MSNSVQIIAACTCEISPIAVLRAYKFVGYHMSREQMLLPLRSIYHKPAKDGGTGMNVTKHGKGRFCWAELSTSDGPGAKAFYTELMGWTAEDNPMGPDMVYTMLNLNGQSAACSVRRSFGQGASALGDVYQRRRCRCLRRSREGAWRNASWRAFRRHGTWTYGGRAGPDRRYLLYVAAEDAYRL